MMKIFYSWQSDIDRKINNSFILFALRKAVEKIKKEANLDIIIDQATRDEPGTPDITNTIFKKIDECAIFVADISFINGRTAKRRTPNPNVLIELGYAIKKLGFEKIILIFNNEFGKVEKLPFDINHRRLMQYKFNASMDRKVALNNLAEDLGNAVLLIDRKTMTKEKIDFVFYDSDEGKQYGKSCSVNGVIYKGITESEFLMDIDFDVIRKNKNEKKLTEWQEYLYKEKKVRVERKMALDKMIGMTNIVEGVVVDQFETNDYYNKYMRASLIKRNVCKFYFLIKNNNEHTMKNIKIVLKTEKKDRIRREYDFPELPPSSTFLAASVDRMLQETKQSLFERKTYGDNIIFEYKRDNLYADEEYVLDEPLYISLKENDIIKIKYTIFSENLSNISGILEIDMKSKFKGLTPIDVFNKL
jgi:hypothetical protein